MSFGPGARLPDVTLHEYRHVATHDCPVGPVAMSPASQARGRRIVLFAVPGAFTPTCSEHHVPGFVRLAAQFRAVGIDEIWCVSVNDAFVMGAWGQQQQVGDAVRMLADGSGEFARAVGLTVDLSARGLGTRSRRYAMLVDDGTVTVLHVEDAGQFGASSAESMLEHAQAQHLERHPMARAAGTGTAPS